MPAKTLPSRPQIGLWVAVLALATAISLWNYQSIQIGVNGDDSEYAVLARSLVFSRSYGLINIAGQAGSARYPFGYPLVLAPVAWLWPDQLDALKIPSLIATLLNAALLFWGWRSFSKNLSYWWGLAVSSLYVLSPLTIGQARVVMSEPVFTTFCLASIVLAERARERRQGWLWFALMSLCLLLTVFTRTIGLVLVLVIWGYLFAVRGRMAWKEIAGLAAGMAVLLALVIALTPVQLSSVIPSVYASQFAAPSKFGQAPQEDTIPGRVVLGVRDYVGQYVQQVVLPVGGGEREAALAGRIGLPALPALIGLVVALVVAFGLFQWAARQGISVALMFAAAYLAVILLWPWRSTRFLYPVQPQLFLGFLLGMSTLLAWALAVARGAKARSQPRRLAGLLGGLVLAMAALSVYKGVTLTLDDSWLHTGDLALRTAWLRSNSDGGAIVMSEEPQTDYLYGGRKTVPYASFGTPEQLDQYLRDQHVTYIVVASQLQWQTAYAPAYSSNANQILALIETLARDGRARLAYNYEPQLVRIYQVSPSPAAGQNSN